MMSASAFRGHSTESEPTWVLCPRKSTAILVDVEDTTPRALAFIMAHEECSTSGATRRDRLAPFLRSIDEIEQRTGLDFMWLLDDQAEQQLETTAATAMW